MSPRTRLVVHYNVGNEVVVDSAIMEVEETYPNQVMSRERNRNIKCCGTDDIESEGHNVSSVGPSSDDHIWQQYCSLYLSYCCQVWSFNIK